MRYEIRHEGRVVALSEYADLAEAMAANSPVPVGVLDTFTGKLLEVVRVVPQAGGVLTEEQLPWSTIDSFIMQDKKIPAIKLVRELTRLGLGEAKQVVDRRASLTVQRRVELDNDRRY